MKDKKRLIAAPLIAWIVIAIAGYYAFHHPLDESFILNLAPSLTEIAISVLLVTIAGGLGRKVVPNFKTFPLPLAAIQAALGLGILSVGYLVAGSLWGTARWLAWMLALALLVWLRKESVDWGRSLATASGIWSSSDGFGKWIALFSAAIFVLAMLTALAPPLKFDALVYHLTLPELYILNGRINYVDQIMYWGFPQLPHMLSTWALSMGAPTGALIGWFMGILCVFGLIGHLNQRLGLRASWVAVAALLSGTSLAASLGWSYVDWPTMLMGWAMIFWLDQWMEGKQDRSAVLAGVFAGLAFGAKYTAGILGVFGLLVILIRDRTAVRATISFLLAGFGAAVPWLLKNFVATGNPFYPLIFAAGAMDELRLAYYQGFAVQGNWLDALLLPVRATWLGIEGGRILNAPGYEGSIGPLLLTLSPLAVLARPHRKSGNLRYAAGILAVGGLAIWAVAGRISGHLVRTHLYYSIFPAFAILSAYGFLALEKFKLPNLRLDRVIGFLVCVVLALNLLKLEIETVNSANMQQLTGKISEQEFLELNLGRYAIVAKYLKEEMPTGERTVMLWETRGYYCLPVCEPDEVIDRWIHDLAVYGNPTGVFEYWREMGFDSVLYYRLAAEFVHQDPEHFHSFDLQELEDGLATLQIDKDFGDDYVLYSLN